MNTVRNPTESEILKYILIKNGYFTEEEYIQGKNELINILIEEVNKTNREVEKFVQDFLNS